MSPEVTEAPHIRGISVRKETGEKQAGLGANKRAGEEPDLHKLPVRQEVWTAARSLQKEAGM